MSVRTGEYDRLPDGSEPGGVDFEFFVRQPPEQEAEEIRLAQARAIRAVLQWARQERVTREVQHGQDEQNE